MAPQHLSDAMNLRIFAMGNLDTKKPIARFNMKQTGTQTNLQNHMCRWKIIPIYTRMQPYVHAHDH